MTDALVDQRSLELAEHFLADVAEATDDDRWNLAAAIQQAVEDWFYSREHADSIAAMGVTCSACGGDGSSGTYYGDGSPHECGTCGGEGIEPQSSESGGSNVR